MVSDASLKYLLASCLFLFLSILAAPLCSFVILRYLGNYLQISLLAEIHISRLPAKYLPGGVWHMVGRGVDLKRHGMSVRESTTLFTVEHCLALFVSALLGGFGLYFYCDSGHWCFWLAVCLFSVGVFGLLTLPIAVGKLVPTQSPRLSRGGRFPVVVLSYVLAWAFISLAFAFYIAAFPSLGSSFELFHLLSIYLVSWCVSFVALFAPQGIGVFEVLASALLVGELGLEQAIPLVLGFRLVFVITDITVWFGFRFFKVLQEGEFRVR